ncbi:MAG: ubiquinone/menaquinone biosynthesis methyltransferase [Candidatus Zixiibacteriota bacterium]
MKKVYSDIPGSYELVNHLLTMGTDIITRRRAAKIAVRQGGDTWLDICCGTGEMTANLMRLKKNGTKVFGADFSPEMIALAVAKPENKEVGFTISEAEHLPYRDNFFDIITISYATRNLNSTRELLIQRFSEINRVLKPGGTFVNLETSQPRNKLFRKIMHLYVGVSVARIGALISGNKAGYAYLAASIPRFYEPDELCKILKASGFSSIDYTPMFFGAIAAHRAVK